MLPYQLEKTGAQCVATWRHFSWVVLFILLWLAGWTVGCVALAGAVFIGGHFAMIPIALPFWGGWILVAGWVTNLFFGKTRIRLDSGGFESDWNCLFVHRHKRIAADEIRRFEIHGQQGSKGSQTFSLRVVCRLEKDADYSIPSGGGVWETLCEELNGTLAILVNDPTIADESSVPEKTGLKRPEPIPFPLDSKPQGIEPPDGSAWKFETEFDSFDFRKRGVFSLSNCCSSLFAACFWNGIVSVFILGLCGVIPSSESLQGGIWWLLFFFLIPFEIIGLVLIYAFFTNIMEPFRVTKWSFRFGQAAFQSGFAGATTFSLGGWSSMTVRLTSDLEDEQEDCLDEDDIQWYDEDYSWELAFLDSDEKPLATIDGLYKSEALWMADVVLRQMRSIR